MSTKKLKISINQLIEQINDDTILEAYYEILVKLLKVQRAQIVGFNLNGESITREGLEAKVDDARNRIESGQSIQNSDLKNDFKNW